MSIHSTNSSTCLINPDQYTKACPHVLKALESALRSRCLPAMRHRFMSTCSINIAKLMNKHKHPHTQTHTSTHRHSFVINACRLPALHNRIEMERSSVHYHDVQLTRSVGQSRTNQSDLIKCITVNMRQITPFNFSEMFFNEIFHFHITLQSRVWNLPISVITQSYVTLDR